MHQSADATDVIESKKRYYKSMAKTMKEELIELRAKMQGFNSIGI